MDAYDILGVARGASLEKVKTNFRKLALELHPDKGGSEHLFNVLKKSYVQVLQDIKEKRNNKDFHELKEDHEEFKRTEQQMKHMHIDEEKEDDVMRQFHKVFLKNKVVSEANRGYGEMMQKTEPRKKINIEKKIKKFSIDHFNHEFNKSKPTNNKHLVKKYNPEPFVLSKTLPYTELGVDKVVDFSNNTDNKRDLQYSDYMKAYTTNRLVENIDERNIGSSKTVKELEADRSKVSFHMSDKELKKYTKYKHAQENKEKERVRILEKQDHHIQDLHHKVNAAMLSYKT